MAKSWPGGKTTLYLIAPQRQPPAALTGSFSCIVLFLFDSIDNACLGVCLLLKKQIKKSIGRGRAAVVRSQVVHGHPTPNVSHSLGRGSRRFDDVFGDLVRGNNAPYHGVTGVGCTTRKVLLYLYTDKLMVSCRLSCLITHISIPFTPRPLIPSPHEQQRTSTSSP